jgi:hypothetical protein
MNNNVLKWNRMPIENLKSFLYENIVDVRRIFALHRFLARLG